MPRELHIQRYLLTGLLTVFPIWLTWIVFEFVLRQLSKLGAPVVDGLAQLAQMLPSVFGFVLNIEWVKFLLAASLTIVFLYVLGLLANRVIGMRALAWLDSLMARIPLVQTIYGGTKKLLAALQTRPEGAQRVVLIDFPHRDMKAVGFVTRVIKDSTTGRELAAVYVPTTPNPTSGYLEIVPVEQLTPTDWTVDQAMAFIISGGAVSPPQIPYSRSAEATAPP